MSEPQPFKVKKDLRKEYKDIRMQWAIDVLETLSPDERKARGLKMLDRIEESIYYRERTKDNLVWLVVGVPIGVSVGFLIAWYMFVYVPLLASLGVI